MKKWHVLVLVVAAIIMMSGCSKPQGLTPSEQKDTIITMKNDTLAELYREKPEAKDKIRRSAGYGVFSNVNVNLLLASVGNGYGIVVDKATGDQTYMKMGMGGVGIGLGVKDFRAVIIFKTQQALNKFVVSGWEFGGHADAAAKAGEKGGAVGEAGDITSDMEIYQFTKNGIALQATITGTKYWKDAELND